MVFHNRQRIPSISTVANICYSPILKKREAELTTSEDHRLAELSKIGICPNCGRVIKEGTRVVRGSGAFCSLDCVASYHQAEFSERARRLAAAAQQQS